MLMFFDALTSKEKSENVSPSLLDSSDFAWLWHLLAAFEVRSHGKTAAAFVVRLCSAYMDAIA